jgi:hypothetical protein
MAFYITRVELPDRRSDHPDYVTLHTSMIRAGFFAEVMQDGAKYRLPHGTYSSSQFASAHDATIAAHSAASSASNAPRVASSGQDGYFLGLLRAT